MDRFKKAYDFLQSQLKGELLLNEPLFKYTTLRLGGPAALYAKADSLSDLKKLLSYSIKNDIPYFVIGRGANLLVSDNGYRGLVIHLGNDFNLLKVNNDKAQVTAGAAVSLARVLQEAYANAFDGLTFAAGIPATVGGAIASNAGAFGKCVCDYILQINTLTVDGIKSYKQPLKAGYRQKPVAEGEIIIEAIFQLEPGDKMSIKARTEALFKKRKSAQPLNYPNAGSIFKNPSDDIIAGQLIDDCGLKSCTIGQAMISEQHANFIVNKGSAKAEDVYKLMKLAQKAVQEKHGIGLEPEIKLLGDFDG